MATKHFDCASCGAHGKISFKETDTLQVSDIAYCPACGGDIYEPEKFEDEDE
jgi:rubredoxin